MQQINELELFRSCQVLFGGQLDVSREFLEYIQWSGVKSAYRKKVRETHPDGAAREGELVQRKRADEFRSVQEAYENLSNFLAARDKGYRLIAPIRVKAENSGARSYGSPSGQAEQNSSRHRRKEGPQPVGGFAENRRRSGNPAEGRPSRPVTSSLYKGPLPRRRLLFGHFLYYSGLINWRTIVKALAWQRNNRPRIGELGKRVGLLSEVDVEKVIRNRKGMESFGQSAISMRLLNQKQLKGLILQQKRLQRKFGEFFIAHRIFSPEQLEDLVQECQRHNAQFAP
ncbi:MAG: DnaJ domain-containing protein [Proteobacteria bacterium]|nr:DnaJ domain-containing protein [Pseudomonadota bacterium]MBU1736981.1 DnaJ domain-containing protein [Pseudomonadota bacterium]